MINRDELLERIRKLEEWQINLILGIAIYNMEEDELEFVAEKVKYQESRKQHMDAKIQNAHRGNGRHL